MGFIQTNCLQYNGEHDERESIIESNTQVLVLVINDKCQKDSIYGFEVITQVNGKWRNLFQRTYGKIKSEYRAEPAQHQ